MSAPANSAQLTPERIMKLNWGFAPTLVLGAALRHGVFDRLENGPKTLAELAGETHTSERGLRSILNVLVGLEFLSKSGEQYALTAESAAFLVSGKPGFMGGLLRHATKDLIVSWLQIDEVVASGKPSKGVNQEAVGSEFFQKLVPEIFPMNYPAAQGLAAHLKLGGQPQTVKVLDLAAGSAVWSIALAQSGGNVQATALDWPPVIEVTKKIVARFGLAERFSYIAGDLMSADFGGGYQVATLGHILHSEGQQRSKRLLRKVFEALAPGGTIAIAEFLVNADRTGPVMGLIFGVNMLVNTDEGDTYSFEEISEWLKQAGFVAPRTLEGPGASPLILATRP